MSAAIMLCGETNVDAVFVGREYPYQNVQNEVCMHLHMYIPTQLRIMFYHFIRELLYGQKNFVFVQNAMTYIPNGPKLFTSNFQYLVIWKP